ncbi:MAG: hypothetical protein QW187_01030 [Candidatus Korarchaeum sp.]
MREMRSYLKRIYSVVPHAGVLKRTIETDVGLTRATEWSSGT